MEINYICSLGNLCHSAQILKRNKLKNNLIRSIGYFQIQI